MARLTTAAPAVRAERPEVSQALDDVIHRCLARQPAARFGSAAAVRDALDQARLDPTGAIPRPVIAPGGSAAVRRPTPAAGGGGTGPTSPQPVPAPATPVHRRRRRRLTWLWVLLVALLAIGGGVLAFVLVHDDGGSGSGSGAGASLATATKTATITSAASFDPQGDGVESPELVGNAYDGDPTTSWSTEQYDRNFPDGDKHGVGLVLSLESEADVAKVVVTTEAAGWGASIYVSDQDVAQLTTLDAWGPVRAEGSNLDASHTFAVDGVRGRSVLVWITQLPTRTNGQHYVNVSEVEVRVA
jgi:hypothetical protein